MNKNKKFLESQISDAHYIDVLFKKFRNYLQNIFKTTRRSSEFSPANYEGWTKRIWQGRRC